MATSGKGPGLVRRLYEGAVDMLLRKEVVGHDHLGNKYFRCVGCGEGWGAVGAQEGGPLQVTSGMHKVDPPPCFGPKRPVRPLLLPPSRTNARPCIINPLTHDEQVL
jgi:hypothetical protein